MSKIEKLDSPFNRCTAQQIDENSEKHKNKQKVSVYLSTLYYSAILVDIEEEK